MFVTCKLCGIKNLQLVADLKKLLRTPSTKVVFVASIFF